MSFLCVVISFGLALTERVTGQLTISRPPASSCLTPVTFTGCDVLSSKISECSNLPPSATPVEYAACFCTQEVFNAINDCESESRVCARSPNDDHYFDDLRTQWLKTCGPKITFTLTTPILSTYASGTYSDSSCTSTAISACQSVQFLTSQCSSSYSGTTASGYYSCVCQEDAVSQASLSLWIWRLDTDVHGCQYNNLTITANGDVHVFLLSDTGEESDHCGPNIYS
ncbi:hypothetical protein BDV38DRAFT_278687 [Aspergillus pseudotamarii]|uniref:Extracellular membrane protein CFEM domain-containing protein n=1 Tax=Aspergillus pseudotamarii TaxID=132259 RepID=A0A5N6T6E6_ASPPS|nr:uncharacterized protein BDV38DRAFT_278687 [Aspergillus pseudotamarii]KAE8141903.1 hypothetical protein BDV38DRAFT_278687 [Aspergillus pseudotamarii]